MNNVLITGASGFLGKIILSSIKDQYAIITCGRAASNDIICDLSVSVPALNSYNYVIHAAGKAHSVPKNQLETDEFTNVNFQGTVNLTKALEKSGLPQSFVFISTVAVYGVDSGLDIDENYPLLGSSPYAKSKIIAERFVIEWGKKHNVKITVLRLPLVIGLNPPGNLKSIIKAIKRGYYVRIGEGNAKKSMLWAADIASILPTCFTTSGIFNLTDNRDPAIKELDAVIGKKFNKKIRKLPLWVVGLIMLPSKILPFWPINKDRIDKLTTSLTFSSRKASQKLGWMPQSVIDCIYEHGI